MQQVTFKDVFSITWKVILSLTIVSVVAWIIYGLVTAPWGDAVKRDVTVKTTDKDPYDTSDYHTKIPKSIWDSRVAWAVAHHCHFAGMNREEIIRALGQPTETKDYALTYTLPTKDCTRYDGDTCTEYKMDSNVIFLHNGYSESSNYPTADEDCHTISREHHYLGLRIPKNPQAEERVTQARILAQQAAERQSEQERNAEKKRLGDLRAKCAPFVNGSPEQVQSKTMPLPPKECREIVGWMRDAYLDALYDLQGNSQKPQ